MLRKAEATADMQVLSTVYLADRSSATRKRPILVRVQPVETTNRLLDESGIALREAWELPPERLAETLGDAE